MKTTLPFLLLFVFAMQAQTQIPSLNGYVGTGTEWHDGANSRSGILNFAPETVFDQSSAGFDQNWDVSGFTLLDDTFTEYGNTAPTEAELLQFPGATMKTTGYQYSLSEGTHYRYEYFSQNGLMSYADDHYAINYATDNADYGSFPKTYGDLYVDNIAGTFSYDGEPAEFTGTIITEVDAYGILTNDEGTFEVTRLKTVQTLQLNYPIFNSMGSFTQTTYRYYRENDHWPYVKSTNNMLTVNPLGININSTDTEQAPAFFALSVKNPLTAADLSIVPNPVFEATEIVAPGQQMLSVSVVDQAGKEVFHQKGSNNLDLRTLSAGIYLLNILTETGATVKRILKK